MYDVRYMMPLPGRYLYPMATGRVLLVLVGFKERVRNRKTEGIPLTIRLGRLLVVGLGWILLCKR